MVLVGTYTSIFIAAPILIYLGVGIGRQDADEPAPAKFEPEVAAKAAAAAKPRRRSRRQGVRQACGRQALSGGRRFQDAAFSAAGADRRLWQRRLPLRRHVASRLAAVPAERHLGLAGDRACRHHARKRSAPVFAEAADIGLFLIGTGAARWPLPAELLAAFASHKISAETSQTGQAANTYNILLGEGRRVAAALIAVD